MSYRHLKCNNLRHLFKRLQPYSIFLFILVGTIFWLPSCSTEKTGWAHRTYHNTTARFNGYFNAKELVRLKVKELNNEPEDYSKMLPIFKYPTDENLQNVIGDMDKAIEKCKRVISKHSIEKRGDQYVKWIDDTYLLMGRAHFYKQELPKAKEMFNYVSKKFKEEEIRFDALLWLSKTYVEDKNYQKAERILRLAEGESAFPERLKREMHLTYADMFIKQGNYQLAITDIQRAIDLTKKRKEKARLYFILAQVYQQIGERGEASLTFAKVVALNPTYDMIFYARIQRALSFSQDYGGKTEIRKELLEMLKDDKNIEFRDQIYYALAELEMADENEEDAIEYYQESTRASISNDPQKGLSFLKLGDIYFKKPEYSYAQMYYDSAVTFMNTEHERYEDVLKLSRNLNDLIEQINTIERQDSLQKVAQMPEKERLALIDDLIYQRKIEEEEKRQQMENEMAFAENQNNQQGGGPGLPGSGNSNGDWYFYNPTAVGFGASEFKKIWGGRKNEDDWRRSNKSQVAPTNVTSNGDEDGFFVNEDGDTIEVTNDWQDPNYYLKDLPLTEEAMERSDSLIVEAYYNLGLIYKEKLQDDPKAIEAFESLNNRYAEHQHLLTVLYRLYRMHNDLRQYTESDFYKQKILNDFPDSDYAKIIRDPESLKKENKQEKAAKEFYTRVYENYFKRGFYSQTITSAEEGIQKFEGTSVEPKLRFIRAMSIGQDRGESGMREEIEALAFKYKGEPIGKKAEETLAMLDQLKELEKQRQKEASQPEEETIAAENSPYSFEPTSNHNYIVLIPVEKLSSNNAQIAISNFNRANFKSKDLNVSSVLLGGDTAMITIKSFKSAADIKSYARAFKNDKIKLAQIHAANAPNFAISFNNYAVFYQRKNVTEYLNFYQNNYAP